MQSRLHPLDEGLNITQLNLRSFRVESAVISFIEDLGRARTTNPPNADRWPFPHLEVLKIRSYEAKFNVALEAMVESRYGSLRGGSSRNSLSKHHTEVLKEIWIGSKSLLGDQWMETLRRVKSTIPDIKLYAGEEPVDLGL